MKITYPCRVCGEPELPCDHWWYAPGTPKCTNERGQVLNLDDCSGLYKQWVCPTCGSPNHGKEECKGKLTEGVKKFISIGGGPTRATVLPTGAADRKKYPVATGLMDYFPDALCAVANLSYTANEQHNPGQPVHWARGKSTDHADTMMRHFLQRGTMDTDGIRHSVKIAWRALALLQEEIEGEQNGR